jgi:hypothetical protein
MCAQGGDQFAAIVDPSVADEHESPIGAGERLTVNAIFWRNAGKALSHPCIGLPPQSAALTVAGKRPIHTLQWLCHNDFAIPTNHAEDRTHTRYERIEMLNNYLSGHCYRMMPTLTDLTENVTYCSEVGRGIPVGAFCAQVYARILAAESALEKAMPHGEN